VQESYRGLFPVTAPSICLGYKFWCCVIQNDERQILREESRRERRRDVTGYVEDNGRKGVERWVKRGGKGE